MNSPAMGTKNGVESKVSVVCIGSLTTHVCKQISKRMISDVCVCVLQELTTLRTELRNLDAGAFNPLSAIASHMPGLVKYIQQEARQVSNTSHTMCTRSLR